MCVDEAPAWGGIGDLEGYDASELYLVEVYGWGQTVRVYTRWFVEGRMRSGRPLAPLSWSC